MNDICLSDLEAVRLILSGNSVIDWNRASFRSLEEVDRFLTVLHLDWESSVDQERIRSMFLSAMHYLEDHLNLPCSSEIKEIEDIRQIFIWASDLNVTSERQTIACTVLKLMHVLQHMDAAALRHRAPLAEERLLAFAEQQILGVKSAWFAADIGVVEFYGSRKTRESTISKLLAKKEDVASTIFDKLRFRIITKEADDVLPLLIWLHRNAFPYNFVIPGQSHNNLVSFRKMAEQVPFDSIPDNGIRGEESSENLNMFSSASYKSINFIVDVPVCIDQLVDVSTDSTLGRVVFVMAEFQIVDESTGQMNEQGDNAHALYKDRQLEKVKERLQFGIRK